MRNSLRTSSKLKWQVCELKRNNQLERVPPVKGRVGKTVLSPYGGYIKQVTNRARIATGTYMHIHPHALYQQPNSAQRCERDLSAELESALVRVLILAYATQK